MSTASMVLLGAGVAASLAGIWALAGLSERSSMRGTPRVALAAVVGVVGLGVILQRAPSQLRTELSLPLLFGAVGVLGVLVGCSKLDGAVAAKNGPRALRRASGLVLGTFLGMASVAAVSLELVLRSFTHARLGWAFMLPAVATALVAFAKRATLAGAGAKALGRRGLVLAAVGVLALLGGRVLVAPVAASSERVPFASAPERQEAPAPEIVVPPAAAPALGDAASAAARAVVSAAPLASTPPEPPAASGELQLETIVANGMLDADARGGVTRRFDRLQACLAEPTNQQSGTLALKIGIDATGSVTYSKTTGGDLQGTPLANCLLPVFYKMGFAAPASGSAYFEITLRATAR